MNDDNERVTEALSYASPNQPGRRIRTRCPFCEDARGKADRKAALSVERASGLWYCWRCHTGGRLPEPPDPTAVGTSDRETESEPEPLELPEAFFPLGVEPYLSSVALALPRVYLHRRGVSNALISAVGIGACVEGRERGRVIIPVVDRGALRWWVGRDYTGNAERPYLYPKGATKTDCMFNGDALDVETETPAIVGEGCLDAIAVWPHGVAALGMPTRTQAERLARARRPVAVALDGDAWPAAWALACRLRLGGVRAGAVHLPPGKDPDEVPRDWLDAEAARVVDAAL